MAGDFQEQVDEARSGGARRLVTLWLRTGRDLLRQGPAEHLDILRRDLVLTARSCRRHRTLAATDDKRYERWFRGAFAPSIVYRSRDYAHVGPGSTVQLGPVARRG